MEKINLEEIYWDEKDMNILIKLKSGAEVILRPHSAGYRAPQNK